MGKDAAFVALGLTETARSTEITRAFRTLSRRTHPDVGGDPVCFAAIVAAYRSLQRAGLVDREQPTLATPAFVDSYYRRMLRQLDQGTRRLESATRFRPSPVTQAAAGERFADVLDRQLRQVSSHRETEICLTSRR